MYVYLVEFIWLKQRSQGLTIRANAEMIKRGFSEIEDINRRLYLKEIVATLLLEFKKHLVSIVVFGSVGRDDSTADSDIDLLIVSDAFSSSLSNRMELLIKILAPIEQTDIFRILKERGINTWIQLHPLKIDEAHLTRPIYLDMVEDGIILFDKNHFIENILQGLKKKMEILGSKRHFLEDGSWFWDLKPDLKRGEVIDL